MPGANAPPPGPIEIRELDTKSRDFLVDDYKLKVQYLTGQFDRMWNRLSYFLTVELTLFGALGYLVFDTQGRDLRVVLALAVIGVVVSLGFYFVGAEDRFLVAAYRADLRGAANVLAAAFDKLPWYGDHYVGSRSGGPDPFHVAGDQPGVWSRYREETSMTRMPSILGFLLTVVWAIVGVMSYSELWAFAPTWGRTLGS